MRGSQCSKVRKSPPSEAQRDPQGLHSLKQQLGLWDTWTSGNILLPDAPTHTQARKTCQDWGYSCGALYFTPRAPKCTKNLRLLSAWPFEEAQKLHSRVRAVLPRHELKQWGDWIGFLKRFMMVLPYVAGSVLYCIPSVLLKYDIFRKIVSPCSSHLCF